MDKQNIFTNLTDLHVHLGSSSTPNFLWEMAHEQGIKLPTKNYWDFIDSVTITRNTSYENYLTYFHLSELIQSSLFSIEKAVHHAISLSYRKAGITTIELRFNPMLRNRNDEQDLDKIILAAIFGMKKACLEYPVNAGLILMMDRRFSKEKNEIIAEKAIKYRHEGVIGLDIGGPLREDFKVNEVVKPYLKAKAAGLKLTFHTGEVTPASEVREVIDKIMPDRLGHGIRIVDDKDLMKIVKKESICLEICPTSNIRTSAVKSWTELGEIIKILSQNDVEFTINSDGPVFLQTNVREEFKKLIKHKILTETDVKRLSDIALNNSFIDFKNE